LRENGLIHKDRVQALNDRDVQPGDYVLYWMQQSQRAHYNHALEYAINLSNQMSTKIVTVFGLTDHYPDANLRHYYFMLEGLIEVRQTLTERGIKMAVCIGPPDGVILSAARKAAMIVCDRGYLRHQKQWRTRVAQKVKCPVVQVEGDVVVPVEKASGKCEYAARFFRPKINRLIDEYLDDLPIISPKMPSLDIKIPGEEITETDRLIKKLNIDTSVAPVKSKFKEGTREAIHLFDQFLRSKAARYQANRNQPQTDDVSYMGMYLHFGQISPVYLVNKIKQTPGIPTEIKEAYLEELIIRRELAVNYIYYNDHYDSYQGLPNWAKDTLNEHAKDPRTFLYKRKDLENAHTHDPYWNAAEKEMKYTGYMHNYMRMYWVKKIIEWSKTPRQAYRNAIYLNNKFFLDGRDPNSYAGVSWGFGLHDRPWKEREIFGKVRYMNAAGLERKCDINAYVKKVERMCDQEALAGQSGQGL
jgi:deoxyribodipyrimidine photo-lyase